MPDEKRHAIEIPRRTCRLFGAVKALGTIRNCAILVHGPRGCVYHINYILGMRGDRPSAVYTTALDERGVIFGCEQELVRAIEEVDVSLRPELIAVLSCCASSIIGEDVAQAVRRARTTAKTIAIDAGGFEGDFRNGYGIVLSAIAEGIASKKGDMDPYGVNLIGLLRAGPDLRDLKDLLSLLGLRVNAVLTAGGSLAQFERLGEAALNIVLCELAGREAAETLHRRFGTPYIIPPFPIGRSATCDFLDAVSASMGVERKGIPESERMQEIELSDLVIAIIGGPTRTLAICRFIKELGGAVSVVALDAPPPETRMKELEGLASRVLLEPTHQEILSVLEEEHVNLLVGGMLERPIASSLGIEHIDIMHGSQRSIGFQGAEHLSMLLSKAKERVTRGLHTGTH